ncbi:MAG: hypothetical protein ACUVT9_05410 [Candidatus Bathycorpusculaceae bacterium]
MGKTQATIKIYEDTKQRLFELKCAWRLHSFDETIQKLILKASKKGGLE